jgi:hypothetical protein
MKTITVTIDKAVHVRDAHTLLRTLQSSRPDFHEPDEQGWCEMPRLRGRYVDNAFGTLTSDGLARMENGTNCAESHLEMVNEDGTVLLINLANLISLARIGATAVIGVKS